jgi:hypothetical protein
MQEPLVLTLSKSMGNVETAWLKELRQAIGMPGALTGAGTVQPASQTPALQMQPPAPHVVQVLASLFGLVQVKLPPPEVQTSSVQGLLSEQLAPTQLSWQAPLA